MNNFDGDALVSIAKAITSKEDFAVFAKLLLQNYREYQHEWDNATLERYLEALAEFVESIDGYYANIGATVSMDRPSWRVFADILLAGRVYE